MTLQIVVHSTGGDILGKVTPATEDEVQQLRLGITNVFSEDFKYIELDTEAGFVVVPGSQVLYIEARVS